MSEVWLENKKKGPESEKHLRKPLRADSGSLLTSFSTHAGRCGKTGDKQLYSDGENRRWSSQLWLVAYPRGARCWDPDPLLKAPPRRPAGRKDEAKLVTRALKTSPRSVTMERPLEASTRSKTTPADNARMRKTLDTSIKNERFTSSGNKTKTTLPSPRQSRPKTTLSGLGSAQDQSGRPREGCLAPQKTEGRKESSKLRHRSTRPLNY